MLPLAPFCHLLKKFPKLKLVFTGHSFGGVIAAIVTINMLADKRTSDCKDRIRCISFGAPFLAHDACVKLMGKDSRRLLDKMLISF